MNFILHVVIRVDFSATSMMYWSPCRLSGWIFRPATFNDPLMDAKYVHAVGNQSHSRYGIFLVGSSMISKPTPVKYWNLSKAIVSKWCG